MWDVKIFIRFHPSGQLDEGSLLERVGDPNPAREPMPKLFTIVVPPDATKVEMWFYTQGRDQIGWDSRFGQNYWFDVAR
jgi:hypothetical protein